MDRNTLNGWLGGLLGEAPNSPAPLPMDPMDEALPPHLRQFYGSPGSAPTLPPPALQRPQPGQTEAPNDPALMERAMNAAKQAYESVLSGGSGLLGDIGDATSSATGAVGDAAKGAADAMGDFGGNVKKSWNEGRARAYEKFYTDDMNRAREPANWPPLPQRDPSDPYYGREYPSLKRPQPGQDFSDDPPIRGEEWYSRHYIPQEPRRKGPVRPGGVKRT